MEIRPLRRVLTDMRLHELGDPAEACTHIACRVAAMLKVQRWLDMQRAAPVLPANGKTDNQRRIIFESQGDSARRKISRGIEKLN
jgi:hypothetical protein